MAASSRLESRLGEKVSILFRIEGDPEHPYSEVVGLLQRVSAEGDRGRVLHVCRRDGSVTEVAEADVIRLKFVPTASRRPFRPPASWGGRGNDAAGGPEAGSDP